MNLAAIGAVLWAAWIIWALCSPHRASERQKRLADMYGVYDAKTVDRMVLRAITSAGVMYAAYGFVLGAIVSSLLS